MRELETLKNTLLECRCSRHRIKYWERILLDNFKTTEILDIPKVQKAILSECHKLANVVETYERYKRNEICASPGLWSAYQHMNMGSSLPELKHLRILAIKVKEEFQDSFTYVQKVADGTKRNRQTKSRS